MSIYCSYCSDDHLCVNLSCLDFDQVIKNIDQADYIFTFLKKEINDFKATMHLFNSISISSERFMKDLQKHIDAVMLQVIGVLEGFLNCYEEINDKKAQCVFKYL
jgi:hypothetical protein